ncbi:CdaR family protein [Enterococcus sp. LJL128]
MKKASQSNWFSGLLALLFALLLFFNANSDGNSGNTVTTSQVYDEMLYSIPIQLNYDQDQYFVSGYEDTVTVHLSSANRIQLNLEANEDTRKFQVVADLTNVSVGTSEVPLRVTGLSSAVTANIEPATITVTIEKKVTKSFDVEAQIPDSFNAEGYKVESIAVSPKKVEITTGEETMAEIAKVVAPLSSVTQSSDTIKQTVNVQALDSRGQVLSIENPAPQVKVTVQLSLPKKEAALRVVSTGSPPADVSGYTFDVSEQMVEISGSNSVLETIDTLEVPVDVTGISTSVKQTVGIPANGDYTVSPTKIEVTINPVYLRSGSDSQVNGGTGEGTATSNSSKTEETKTSETSSEVSGSGGEKPSSSTSSSDTQESS